MRRLRYLVLATGTVAIGLLVHLGGTFLPPGIVFAVMLARVAVE